MGRMLRRPIGEGGGGVSGGARKGTRGDNRIEGKLRKGEKGWGVQGNGANQEEKRKKKTHIGIIQWIREQDGVPRSGGLVGLVLGDGFGAVKVVLLGYDG